MKYLEQRVEELEKEVALLKAKNKLNDTSSYLNNYPPYDNPNSKDYMYNHSSLTMLSEPDLETAFASPWDTSEIEKNPLDTITVKQPDHTDYEYPGYPNILGSWDEGSRDDVNAYLGFLSEFDKMDKDFLEWLNAKEPHELKSLLSASIKLKTFDKIDA